MTNDKGTIKIPREDFERHNIKRKNLGETWLQYIDGQAPDGVKVDINEEELARAVSAQIDYAMLASKTAEEFEELQGRLR